MPKHIVEVHEFSWKHKDRILASKQCGCFDCCQLFPHRKSIGGLKRRERRSVPDAETTRFFPEARRVSSRTRASGGNAPLLVPARMIASGSRTRPESARQTERRLLAGFGLTGKKHMEEFLANAIEAAVEEAIAGLREGGIPIGAVVLKRKRVIGRGHNRRLQNKDLTAHGEIEWFETLERNYSIQRTRYSLPLCRPAGCAQGQLSLPESGG